MIHTSSAEPGAKTALEIVAQSDGTKHIAL
jgi:hypothetical protein